MNSRIAFSTLLQIVIVLQRDRVLDGRVAKEEIQAVQTAFRTAVVRRHAAYRMLMNFRLRREEYKEAGELVVIMHIQHLDLVYAMSHGCYSENGWAGVVNRRIHESDWRAYWGHTDRRIGRLRLLVGDAWAQQEQLKPTKRVEVREYDDYALLIPLTP